jgi:hypothetical protein
MPECHSTHQLCLWRAPLFPHLHSNSFPAFASQRKEKRSPDEFFSEKRPLARLSTLIRSAHCVRPPCRMKCIFESSQLHTRVYFPFQCAATTAVRSARSLSFKYTHLGVKHLLCANYAVGEQAGRQAGCGAKNSESAPRMHTHETTRAWRRRAWHSSPLPPLCIRTPPPSPPPDERWLRERWYAAHEVHLSAIAV